MAVDDQPPSTGLLEHLSRVGRMAPFDDAVCRDANTSSNEAWRPSAKSTDRVLASAAAESAGWPRWRRPTNADRAALQILAYLVVPSAIRSSAFQDIGGAEGWSPTVTGGGRLGAQ